MSSTLPIVEPSATLVVLDLVGIFVFAISGALVAVRKDLDVFGVLVLAGTTGLGGGFLRDVLIDATPPAALADWRYLLVPVAAGLLTFWFHPALGRMERTVTVFDAFGLGLFCVTGALKALDYGLGPVPAALMGMVTGIGGGMARDVLAGRVPAVFRGELYATPALAGAFVAVLGARLELPVVRRGRGRGRPVHDLAAARDVAALAGPDAHGARQRLTPLAASVAEDPAQVGVGEDPVGVEPVAHREELPEARVRRREVGRGPGVHLAPVRASVVGAHDRLHRREVRRVVPPSERWWVWKARYIVSRPNAVDSGTSSAGATRTSTGKLIRQSAASIARRASRSAGEPGLARHGVLHLPEDDVAPGGEDAVRDVAVAAGGQRPRQDPVQPRDDRGDPVGGGAGGAEDRVGEEVVVQPGRASGAAARPRRGRRRAGRCAW